MEIGFGIGNTRLDVENLRLGNISTTLEISRFFFTPIFWSFWLEVKILKHDRKTHTSSVIFWKLFSLTLFSFY